jgi:NAD(P)-dependent dehydrogenase (short-subunit alcohol dehydrogenase family)
MDLAESAVMLTGATDGIGLATARRLAPQVRHLVLHGPQPDEEVRQLSLDIRRVMREGTTLTYLRADYNELAQVRELAARVADTVERLDVLINNAGRAGPPQRTLSVDGNEATLQTNYLAPFLLTTMLRPMLGGGRRTRIVNVASATHQSAILELDDLNLARHEYSPVRAYAQSKLALVTYTCALAAQLEEGQCEAVSLHPGVITTRLLDSLFHMRGDSPAHAAANVFYVASTDEPVNGRYYDEQQPARPNPIALDARTQQTLLRLSTQLTSPRESTPLAPD